ncbi:MAG: flagellar biosynthetic protein FliR [Oscillospiraceae bacterium]|nr:flagellar biosynthetic protein FliR [Oscillospiraceae bacterium]
MFEIWDLILNNFMGFLIVVFRISGIFTFNPIFGRTNTPMVIRAMMAITLAAMMFSYMGGTTGYQPQSVVGFISILMGEAFIGLVFGVMANLILTVLVIAGGVVDYNVGLMMAQTFDPSTGIQMPVFANMFYYIFIIYFFVVGGHLDYIRLFWLSFELIPIGFEFTLATGRMLAIIVDYLGTVMELALKLAMPLIAAGMVVQFCVGIMMKAVPSIQVLAVNFQLKLYVGLFVLMAMALPMSEFLQRLFSIMRTNLYSLAEGFI